MAAPQVATFAQGNMRMTADEHAAFAEALQAKMAPIEAMWIFKHCSKAEHKKVVMAARKLIGPEFHDGFTAWEQLMRDVGPALHPEHLREIRLLVLNVNVLWHVQQLWDNIDRVLVRTQWMYLEAQAAMHDHGALAIYNALMSVIENTPNGSFAAEQFTGVDIAAIDAARREIEGVIRERSKEGGDMAWTKSVRDFLSDTPLLIENVMDACRQQAAVS